jgi:hypothetical protein
MSETSEITLELLSDVASALRSVAKDALGDGSFSIHVYRRGLEAEADCVVLRVPGGASPAVRRTLAELVASVRAVTRRILPSLPLRISMVEGNEASGLEIAATPVGRPVYGHVIKARPAWLRGERRPGWRSQP